MIKNVYVFGTIINISCEENEEAKKEILKLLYNLDDLCSYFKPESDVSKINNNSGNSVEIHPMVFDIIKKSIHYSEITDGDMDITCRPLLDAKKEKNISDFNFFLSLVNYKYIIIKEHNQIKLEKEGMKIDLGSIVKGYATDLIVDILNKYNIQNAIIDLGGNIYVKGLHDNENWKVGIQDPIKMKKPVGYLELSNKSVVTSGTAERGNHIVNPHTGKVVDNNIKSVSIVADKSIDAEGLSTALFVKGKDGVNLINKMPGIDCIYIDDKRKIYLSDNLKDKFVLLNKRFKIISS